MENFEFPVQPENPQENKEIMQDTGEKWETIGAIQARLKGDRRKIEKIVDTFRQSNPEYFEDRKVKGGPIREHVSPQIIKIIEKELDDFKNIPEASEGWETSTSLSEKLGVVQKTVARIADANRKDHPEYFELRKRPNGNVSEHYSSELVKIIQEKVEKFKNIPEASEGWETSSSLAKKLSVGQATIAKISDQYRKTNPEYFEKSKDKMGNIREYYSTELVKIIQEKIREFKEVPMIKDGWKANRVLAEELGIHENTLKKIANPYRETNPQYFEYQKRKSGGMFESYSPELVELLKKEIEKFKEVPEDYLLWSTNKALAKQLQVNEPLLARIAEQYRKTNPEYFKDFRNTGKRGGRIYEHYSPELINIIKEQINKENLKIPVVPENWQSVADISERVGLSKEEVDKIAKKLRGNYPEEYGKFKENNE